MKNVKDKKEKKVKNYKLKNKWFTAICWTMIITIIVAALLDVLNYTCFQIIFVFESDMGVLCQVITTLVVFVGTTIALTLSLQNEKCYGISLRDFNNLREDQRFSITSIILISFVIPLLNVTFWMFDLMFLCFGTALIAVIFSIYVSITEIPLMLKSEKAQLAVIKRRLLFQWEYKTPFPQNLDSVLKNIVCDEKNLATAYELFATDNEEYNKSLFLTLLEKQEQMAFELDKIEDKEYQRRVADNLFSNVKDVLYAKLNLFSILGNDANNYVYRFTRVLFRLLELPDFKKRTADFVASIAMTQDYLNDDKQRDFVVNVCLSMAACSITNENFDILKAFREEFSSCSFRLRDERYSATMFSLISLHLYYLYNDAQDASKNLKDKIKEFIEFSGIENKTIITSWKKLFSQSLENYTVNFSTFLKYFNFVEKNWDVWLNNSGAHFVTLTEKYILQWYLMSIFHSTNVYNFDYQTLLVNDEMKYHLKQLGDEILETLKTKKLPEKMHGMSSFYIDNDRKLNWFFSAEENNQNLFNFVNDLHCEDINILLKNIATVDRQEVIEKWKREINEQLTSDYGFDSTIEIKNQPRFLNLLMETHSDAINFDEAIVSSIVRSIRHELLRKTPKTIISKGNANEKIEQILAMQENVYSNRYVFYSIKNDLDDNVRARLDSAIKSAAVLDSKILIGNFIMVGNAFSFNLQIESMQDIPLTAEQIANKVDEYKRADGQYVYEGAFISREQVEEIVQKQYYILSTAIKYEIIANEEHLYKIEMHDEEQFT